MNRAKYVNYVNYVAFFPKKMSEKVNYAQIFSLCIFHFIDSPAHKIVILHFL